MAQMVIEKLPELARAVSEPLSRTEKIVMISNDEGVGASKITSDITKIITQLPPIIETMTGLSLEKIVGQLSQTKQTPPNDEQSITIEVDKENANG
jgi:flotillin